MIKLTPRRVVFWLVLVPITIGVWAKILTPPHQGPPPKFQTVAPRLTPTDAPQSPRWDYVICPFAGPCWKDGQPIKGSL